MDGSTPLPTPGGNGWLAFTHTFVPATALRKPSCTTFIRALKLSAFTSSTIGGATHCVARVSTW
eukprot:130599-Karenia_brevis.AAC.1